ncbi:MAG: OmpA family protein [Rhodospirillales bacterium]
MSLTVPIRPLLSARRRPRQRSQILLARLGGLVLIGSLMTATADAQTFGAYNPNVDVDLSVLRDGGMGGYARPNAPRFAGDTGFSQNLSGDAGSGLPFAPGNPDLLIPDGPSPQSKLLIAPEGKKASKPVSSRPVAQRPAPAKPAPAPMATVTRPVAPPPPSSMARSEPPAPARAPTVKVDNKPMPAPEVMEAPKPQSAPEPKVTAKAEAPSAPAPSAPALSAPAKAPSGAAPPPPVVAAPAEEATPTQAPPPAATEQASLSPSGAEAPALRIPFAGGSAKLDDGMRAELKTLAAKIQDNTTDRLQLQAFAGGDGLSASQARRLSLSRALAVRSFLIDNGVRSTRIDVRALGDKTDETPVNRVDAAILKR